MREYVIRNLSVGQKCYVRVSAGNMKGFGETVLANPPYCVPSSMLNRFFYERKFTIIYDQIGGNFLKHHGSIYVIYVLMKFWIKLWMKEKEMELVDHSMEMVSIDFDDRLKELIEWLIESPEITNIRNRRRSYGNLRKNLRQLFQFYPRLARSMKR